MAMPDPMTVPKDESGINSHTISVVEPMPQFVEAINIGKDFPTDRGTRRVLDSINFRVGMGDRMAILGRNGSGKSTLIRILSGMYRPTRGRVHRGLRLSWPLALDGGFAGALTGYDNVRFISRIYNVPFGQIFDYVVDFSELGSDIHEQMRFYSSGMRMRLAFALSMALDFDCYLIDEVILVGDRRFQQKCHDELFDRRKHCAMIIAIHDVGVVRTYCHSALVLRNGRGRVFRDLELAGNIYSSL